MLEALNQALIQRYIHLYVASYSQQLIRSINSDLQVSKIYGILQNNSHISTLLFDIFFVYVLREANACAGIYHSKALPLRSISGGRLKKHDVHMHDFNLFFIYFLQRHTLYICVLSASKNFFLYIVT